MNVDATPALDARLEHLRGKDVDWAPFEGFQTKALAAREFEVFLGGAKGPGKSDLIIMGATRQVNRPLYKALILRESFPELQEMMRRAHRRFPKAGATWNGESKTYTFPSDGVNETGGIIAFGFCTSVKDTGRYQGGEWAYIGFDELGKCPDERIWEELLKEIRCPDPDVILMARGSGNPGDAGHAWCRRRPLGGCVLMNWFRDRRLLPQADGDDGTEMPEPETRLEPYPRLMSIEQDEAIALLKGVVKLLERRIKALEEKK